MFEVVNQGAKSYLPFSPAILAGDFVYVSGQASVDPEGGKSKPFMFYPGNRISLWSRL